MAIEQPSDDTDAWSAGLAHAQAAGVELQALRPLGVVSVRTLEPGDATWARDLGGAAPLPAPGRWVGDPVRVAWRSPTEYLLVTQRPDRLAGVLAALAPGHHPLQVALDRSAGTAGVEVRGRRIDALLARLSNAAQAVAWPGQAASLLGAELPAMLLRMAPDRLWWLVDRSLARHLVLWLCHACERMDGAAIDPPPPAGADEPPS